MKTKFISTIVLSSIIATSLIPSVSSMASVKRDVNTPAVVQQNQESSEAMINTVKQFVKVNNDGFITLSAKTPRDMYDKYNLNGLNAHFNKLNEQVRAGNIIINNDLSIIELNHQVKAGRNYTKVHWWGNEIGYSHASARKAITSLQNVAIGAGTVAGVGGALGNILVAIGGGITAGYCGMMANSMQSVNDSNGQRGIVVDVNWAAIYTVYSQ